MTSPEILSALKAIEDKLTRTPTAFRWTPAMSAVFPVRLTMSQLTAMWDALHGAAEYTVLGALAEPAADGEGWIAHREGDPCPVPKGTLIDVKDYDGYIWENVQALESNATGECFWNGALSNQSLLITHWRPAK